MQEQGPRPLTTWHWGKHPHCGIYLKRLTQSNKVLAMKKQNSLYNAPWNTSHKHLRLSKYLNYTFCEFISSYPQWSILLSIPLSPDYFRARNENEINFSTFIISGSHMDWQHFRWPLWTWKVYCMSDTVKKRERVVGNIWYFNSESELICR